MLKSIFISIVTLLLLPLVLTSSIFAQQIERSEVTLVEKGEVINQDYFAAGEKVTVAGTVNGDAYLAGGNIIVEGEINGDLMAAGGTVIVRGKISQDVRVAAGQIVISGEVGGNITSLGGSVTITDSAKVNGSLTAATGNLSVFAPIGKGATIGVGEATISNIVGGNIQAGVGSLTLGPNAQIDGDLTYVSENVADIQSGAQISGKTTHNLPPKPDKEKAAKAITAAALIFKVISFVAILLIGLLLLKFFPTFTNKIAQTIEQKPRAALGFGLIAVILAPILIVLLLITVIGIPISLILLFAFLITLYFSKIFVSLVIGKKTFKWINQKAGDYQALFVGLIIYYLITALPIIGTIVSILAILAGVGAVLIIKKELYSQFRSKKLL